MTIQEAQEQIKSTSFVENVDIFHKQSFKDRVDTLALFTIIEALQNGYRLCKVDEVIDNIEQARQYKGLTNIEIIDSHNIGLDKYFDLGLDKAITIIKEACE
jgi:hypothetical protein